MAEENSSRGYRRIQGVLANPGYPIDKLTVRTILRCNEAHPDVIAKRDVLVAVARAA
jgi:hypothetical protein